MNYGQSRKTLEFSISINAVHKRTKDIFVVTDVFRYFFRMQMANKHYCQYQHHNKTKHNSFDHLMSFYWFHNGWMSNFPLQFHYLASFIDRQMSLIVNRPKRERIFLFSQKKTFLQINHHRACLQIIDNVLYGFISY